MELFWLLLAFAGGALFSWLATLDGPKRDDENIHPSQYYTGKKD